MNELTPATVAEPQASERTDLTIPADGAVAIPEGPGALLSAIVQLARDKSIDREMLAFLMDRQERMENRQAEEEFDIAMATCQSEMQPIARDRRNEQTKSNYATLFAVVEAIRPIYTRHGFSLVFGQEAIEGPNVRITCDVSRGRHTVRKYMDAPPDTLGPKGSAVKTALHGLGSTNTYLRNKLTCGIFNVVLRNDPSDDDGNRGGARFINDEQIGELVGLAQQAERNEGQLLDRLSAGKWRSFDEVPTDAFVVVKSTLEGIIKQQQQKKASTDGQV